MRIGSIIIFHLSKLWKAKFSIRCYITGEAAGEIWNWSLLGVKGLIPLGRRKPKMEMVLEWWMATLGISPEYFLLQKIFCSQSLLHAFYVHSGVLRGHPWEHDILYYCMNSPWKIVFKIPWCHLRFWESKDLMSIVSVTLSSRWMLHDVQYAKLFIQHSGWQHCVADLGDDGRELCGKAHHNTRERRRTWIVR